MFHRRKTADTSKRPQSAAVDEYSKLHKKLSRDNKNKDLRMKQQAHLDEYLENRIGPSLWQSINPTYTVDVQAMTVTHNRATFGERPPAEPVDKVYFRQADWISKYAEALTKSKSVLTNKK